jgi:hypothetical protein
MEASLLTELEGIHRVVAAARLSDEVRPSVAWCLGCLPALYGEFSRTCESRYGDEIRRLVDAVLQKVTDAAARGAVLDNLRAMHARLGIPYIQFAAAKQARKKPAPRGRA